MLTWAFWILTAIAQATGDTALGERWAVELVGADLAKAESAATAVRIGVLAPGLPGRAGLRTEALLREAAATPDIRILPAATSELSLAVVAGPRQAYRFRG